MNTAALPAVAVRMLCIPTLTPRPLDDFDKLCDRWFTANIVSRPVVYRELRAYFGRIDKVSANFPAFCDDCYSHGRTVNAFTR